MFGVRTAGHDVDPIVRPAALTWIQTRRRVGDARHLAARALHHLAGAPLRGEIGAHVMQHRILHGDLQPMAFTGLAPLVQCAQDRDCHQHAGSGVAERNAWLHRLTPFLAGHADRAPDRLRDHIEREIAFVWTALAEAFHLTIDNLRVDRLHVLIAETETLDRTGCEILYADIRLA